MYGILLCPQQNFRSRKKSASLVWIDPKTGTPRQIHAEGMREEVPGGSERSTWWSNNEQTYWLIGVNTTFWLAYTGNWPLGWPTRIRQLLFFGGPTGQTTTSWGTYRSNPHLLGDLQVKSPPLGGPTGQTTTSWGTYRSNHHHLLADL